MPFMALIGIVLASLVNFWLKSEALMGGNLYRGGGVCRLTAYAETEKISVVK